MFRKLLGNVTRLLPKCTLGRTLPSRRSLHRALLGTASLLLIPTSIHLSSPDTPSLPTIIHIEQEGDASKLDLHGHTLLWYECTGLAHIDDEVIAMLNKFVAEYEQLGAISSPFKVVIDRTIRSRPLQAGEYYKIQAQLFVVKPGELKNINISRSLSYSGVRDLTYSALFQRINKQINQFPEVNNKNVDRVTSKFTNRSYQSHIVMLAPKQHLHTGKAKKKLNSFIDSKQTFNQHANKMLVTDDEASRKMGLPAYDPQGDNVYVLVPQSENVIKPGQAQAEINGIRYNVYKPESVHSSVVFPPYLQKLTPDSHTLKISIDMNQNVSSQLAELYEQLRQFENYPLLSTLPRYLSFSSTGNKNEGAIRVMLEKNNFTQIVGVYAPGCRLTDEQKKHLLSGENIWKYDSDEITAESLQKWVGDVLAHKVSPHFETEPMEKTNVKQYNSLRLTGQQYTVVINNDPLKPKIIFHYSQHCHSCKKFKHIYEQIAGEKPQYEFYRIDNDHNKTPQLRNYNSTPVFVFYKNGTPYYYKNTIFTKEVFRDFLEITDRLATIDKSLLDRAVEERSRTEFKMSDLI